MLQHIITSKDDFLDREATIEDVIEKMSVQNLSCVVLLDDGKPVGILTHRDMIKILSNGVYKNRNAYEVSSKELVIANELKSAYFGLELLVDNFIRRVIVVGDNGHYIGVLTQEEILEYISKKVNNTYILEDFLADSQVLHVVDKSTTIHKSVEAMNRAKMGAVAIMDEGRYVGIFTESDMINSVALSNDITQPVSRFMSSPILLFKSTDKIDKVYQEAVNSNIRRVIFLHDNKPYMLQVRDIQKYQNANYVSQASSKIKKQLQYLNSTDEIVFIVDISTPQMSVNWANKKAKAKFPKHDNIQKVLHVELWKKCIDAIMRGETTIEDYILINNDTYRLVVSYIGALEDMLIKVTLTKTKSINNLNLNLAEKINNIQNELQDANVFLDMTFEQNICGVVFLDENAVILDANEYMLDITGYERKDIIGKKSSEFSHPDDFDLATVLGYKESVGEYDGLRTFEKRYKRKDGSYIWTDVSVIFKYNKKTSKWYVVAFIKDMTKYKDVVGDLKEQYKLLNTVVNSVDDYIFYKDKELRYLGGNDKWLELFNKPKKDIIGKCAKDIHKSDIYKICNMADEYVMKNKKSYTCKEELNTFDRHITMETTKSPLLSPNGDIVGIVGVSRDITNKLQEEKKAILAHKVFQNAYECILITNEYMQIIDANPSFVDKFGYTVEEVSGKNPISLLYNKEGIELNNSKHQEELLENGFWQGEMLCQTKDGELVSIQCSISEVKDNDNKVINYIGTMFDITNFKQTEESLKDLAHRDSLTGLLNRILLMNNIEELVKESKHSSKKFAIMFIDMDKFKSINDTYGHEVGDVVLRKFSAKLSTIFSKIGVVYRYGGDEFVVCIKDFKGKEWLNCYVDDFVSLLQKDIFINGITINTKCSVGLSIYPDDSKTAKGLIKVADKRMYDEKAYKRNLYMK